MKTLDEIVRSVTCLPPLPGTVLKLIGVINNPTSSMHDIVEAIRYDQAITGDILRLCNSAYFGLSRKVTSLDEAMLVLGTMKVLQLAMSVHTNAILAQEQRGYGLAPGVLWRHSVAVALAAVPFAERLKLPNVNLAFTAGLMHDLGKVVLNEYVAEEFAEIVRRVREEALAFTEAEKQVLGFSHDEVGALIADRWQLPEPIVRCIRHHHSPGDLDPPDGLVDAVYLANCVCLLLGIGLGEYGLFHRAEPEVMQRHQLHEHDLEEIGARMMTELRRVEQLFESDAPETGRTSRSPGRVQARGGPG